KASTAALFVAIVLGAGVVSSAEPVVWRHVRNASATGGTLVRSSSRGLWDAGGVSAQAIGSGAGYVQFKATQTSTLRMVGLGKGDTGQAWQDIDYAIYLTVENAEIQIYESGVGRGSF